MLTFSIYFLTVLLVLNCALLILLVLIQLPKKEAGAGLAFGGGATDALFGAGSGNVLTRITKYLAGTFFILSLALSVLNTHASRQIATASDLRKALDQPVKGSDTGLPAAGGNGPAMTSTNSTNAIPPSLTALTNLTLPRATNVQAESAPAAPATNPPAGPAK